MAEEVKYNNTLVSGRADETLTYTKYVKDESSGKSTKELLDEKVNKTDQLGTTQIADKAVTTEKLENESVTTDKLDAASVTTDKVADANITTSKLADSSVETEKINNSAVTTDKLNDGAVGNSKLSPEAVTYDKVKDKAIITEKLNDRAVTTEKVEERAITNPKLGNQSVDGRVVREASLETKHFANGSVTTEKVARKSITNDKLADNAVNASQVVDGSIGNSKLSPDSVTTEKIKDSSVTNEKVADDTLGIEKFDPELRKTIQAATGLPEDLSQMIQDVDKSIKQLKEKDTDHQSQIDDKQQQITANKSAQDKKNASLDENMVKLNTRDDQITETLKNISATGGASVASAVTYDNTTSQLTSANIQGAVDELQVAKIGKTSILQGSGEAEDKVMSQKAVSAKLSDLGIHGNNTNRIYSGKTYMVRDIFPDITSTNKPYDEVLQNISSLDILEPNHDYRIEFCVTANIMDGAASYIGSGYNVDTGMCSILKQGFEFLAEDKDFKVYSFYQNTDRKHIEIKPFGKTLKIKWIKIIDLEKPFANERKFYLNKILDTYQYGALPKQEGMFNHGEILFPDRTTINLEGKLIRHIKFRIKEDSAITSNSCVIINYSEENGYGVDVPSDFNRSKTILRITGDLLKIGDNEFDCSFVVSKGKSLSIVFENCNFVIANISTQTNVYGNKFHNFPMIELYCEDYDRKDYDFNLPSFSYANNFEHKYTLASLICTNDREKILYKDNFRPSVRNKTYFQFDSIEGLEVSYNNGLILKNTLESESIISYSNLPVHFYDSQLYRLKFRKEKNGFEELYIGIKINNNDIKIIYTPNYNIKIKLNETVFSEYTKAGNVVLDELCISLAHYGIDLFYIDENGRRADSLQLGIPDSKTNPAIYNMLSKYTDINSEARVYIGFKIPKQSEIILDEICVSDFAGFNIGADYKIVHDIYGNPITDSNGKVYFTASAHTNIFRGDQKVCIYKLDINTNSLELHGILRGDLGTASVGLIYDNIKKGWYIIYTPFENTAKLRIAFTKADIINYPSLINIKDIEQDVVFSDSTGSTYDADILFHRGTYIGVRNGGYRYKMKDPMETWNLFSSKLASGEGAMFTIFNSHPYVTRALYKSDGVMEYFDFYSNKDSVDGIIKFDINPNADHEGRDTPSWGSLFSIYDGIYSHYFAIIFSMRTSTNSSTDYTYGDLMIYKALNKNKGREGLPELLEL